MRILVTGSRNADRFQRVFNELTATAHQHGFQGLVIVHGACPTGVDHIAAYWCDSARRLGVIEERHPANWDSCGWDCPPRPHRRWKQAGDRHHPGMLDDYCPGAGPRRNKAMVDSGADLCLAFPLGRSSGTRGCMRLAAAVGIPVKEHTP